MTEPFAPPSAETWVVLPTYNEVQNLAGIASAILEALPDAHLLVVDDASPDGTGSLADSLAAADPRVEVLHRAGKEGLGRAYVDGFADVLARGAGRVIQMDADWSHAPDDLPALTAALDAGADLVIGSRYVRGGGVRDWGIARRIVSRGGSMFARLVLGLSPHDLTGGFKAWRAAALEGIEWQRVHSGGYVFQIEMTYLASRAGARVTEVPIVFKDREVGTSKMSKSIILEALVVVLQLRWEELRGRGPRRSASSASGGPGRPDLSGLPCHRVLTSCPADGPGGASLPKSAVRVRLERPQRDVPRPWMGRPRRYRHRDRQRHPPPRPARHRAGTPVSGAVAPGDQALAPGDQALAPIDRAIAPGDRPVAPDHLNVTIVAANPFEFDSRFLRSATSLAADGHRLRILGWSAPGLPAEEELAPGVRLTRLDIDRRISSALRPLPGRVRGLLSRFVGLDPEARVLPAEAPRGLDRLRHPLRRGLEVIANARRAGPWADVVVARAPETDVFHAQSLIVLPVVRTAARRLGGRFVYDVADYHTEAARLARMPWLVRELVRRRERAWARDAAAFLTVSDPVADLLVRRWDIPRPTVLWNCPPAWRPEEPGPIGRTVSAPRPASSPSAPSSSTRVASPSTVAWRSSWRPRSRLASWSSAPPSSSWATGVWRPPSPRPWPLTRGGSTCCRRSGQTTSCPGRRAPTSASWGSRHGR